MSFFSQRPLLRHGTTKHILKMPLRSLAKQAEKYSQSSQRSSWTEETPATSSICRTLEGMPVPGTHSMPTVLRRPLRSFMNSTQPTSRTRHLNSLSRLNKRRVPSKTARLAYRLYVRKAFQKAPAIMGYSTLGFILNGLTQGRGKTRWSSTTSSMSHRLSQIMKSSSSSSRRVKKTTSTSAKMLLSTASVILDCAALASSASGLTPLIRLR